MLTVVVTVWSLVPFKAMFAKTGSLASTVFYFPIEGLDKLVTKVAPIVASPKPYEPSTSWTSSPPPVPRSC